MRGGGDGRAGGMFSESCLWEVGMLGLPCLVEEVHTPSRAGLARLRVVHEDPIPADLKRAELYDGRLARPEADRLRHSVDDVLAQT